VGVGRCGLSPNELEVVLCLLFIKKARAEKYFLEVFFY